MPAPLRALASRLAPGLLAGALLAAPAIAQEPPAPPSPPGAAAPAPSATAPAPGAEPAPSDASAGPDRAAIEARRQETAAERAALEARAAGAGAEVASESGLAGQIARLERLERLYGRQLEELDRRDGQATLLAEADRQIEAGPGASVGAEPPFALALLDALLDAGEAQRAREPELARAVEAAEKRLAETRRAFDEREAARRAAKDALAAAADDPARGEAQRALRLAELSSRIARERVVAEQLALANARTDLEIARKTERTLAERIAFVEERLALDEDELATRLDALERQEFALREQQPEAAQALKSAERRLAAVQKRADAEAQPGPALAAELEARRLEVLAAQRRVARLEEDRERLTELRRLWQARVRVLAGEVSREEMRTWARELPNVDADRERDRRLLEGRVADLERDRADRTARAAQAASDPTRADEQRWLAAQVRTSEAALAETRAQLADLAENERLARRLARALGVREERATLADRAGDAVDAVGEAWSTELFAVDDSAITVGKVATAILVFGLGLVAARLLARGLAALVRRRSGLDEGAVSALQSLVSYALVAAFFLIALRSVDIPLTAFTVAGGALAIGVGFGSQAIVNNFVSGLILMVERPIKVGDLVVLDGASGRVERIGPRSTRIRTFDNVHLIVPNSKLLENNVVNWTLSDDLVRTRITIGVAYGSPTREVEALLRELVAAQPDVLKHPEPVVLFDDFGADALQFQADFWVRLSPLVDQRVVRSNLRHDIDEAFRRRGIAIAFPQRDVHLDAARPLPVRMVRDGEEGAA